LKKNKKKKEKRGLKPQPQNSHQAEYPAQNQNPDKPWLIKKKRWSVKNTEDDDMEEEEGRP
jgi:hypothetical protein